MRAPANGRPACRKQLWSLFGGRASETPRHTPRDTSSNQEADHLRGDPAQPDGMFAPRQIRRGVPQSASLDPRRRGRIRGGGEPSRKKVRPVVEKEEKKKRRKRGSLVLPAGVSSGPFPCWMASVASFLVPGAWCCVVGGGFESRHRTSSTRPHEADRCK